MAKFELNDDGVVVIIGSGAGGGTLAHELTRRGMKPEDLDMLRDFPKSHDVNSARASALLPIATGFSRTIRKYDKLKRPVPENGYASPRLRPLAALRSPSGRDAPHRRE